MVECGRKGVIDMFLIKCDCGCIFTVKKEALSQYKLRCQNCKKEIRFYDISNVLESSKELFDDGLTISAIPDDAKITVTFDT